MSRDYKKPERRSAARGSAAAFLVGMLVGLLLGLGVALAVAWYINKMPSPFAPRAAPAAKAEAPRPAPGAAAREEAGEAKPRFEFYKILPGAEPQVAETPKTARPGPASAAQEAFFLQAGAFTNAQDADHLKARLALLGIEASVHTATLPDKGVWHRVRVGPYTSIEELNRTREALKQNGVETTLVRVREAESKN